MLNGSVRRSHWLSMGTVDRSLIFCICPSKSSNAMALRVRGKEKNGTISYPLTSVIMVLCGILKWTDPNNFEGPHDGKMLQAWDACTCTVLVIRNVAFNSAKCRSIVVQILASDGYFRMVSAVKADLSWMTTIGQIEYCKVPLQPPSPNMFIHLCLIEMALCYKNKCMILIRMSFNLLQNCFVNHVLDISERGHKRQISQDPRVLGLHAIGAYNIPHLRFEEFGV